jgi:hypothetical protein
MLREKYIWQQTVCGKSWENLPLEDENENTYLRRKCVEKLSSFEIGVNGRTF